MPKNVQTWAMLGLAVLMVSIMWLTGGKKPQTLPKSGTSTVQNPAPLEVNEGKIAELQKGPSTAGIGSGHGLAR